MDLQKALEKLNSLELVGEVKLDNDKLFWYYEENENDPNLASDLMWDVYCENANLIRNEGYDTENS